jgi:hypothetical protein
MLTQPKTLYPPHLHLLLAMLLPSPLNLLPMYVLRVLCVLNVLTPDPFFFFR